MPKSKTSMATRRETIKQLFKGAGYAAMGGLTWGGMIKDSHSNPFVLRPPGAIEEKEFVKACIKCSLCIEACPYDSLKLATSDLSTVVGTPYFKAREIPCYMCTDVPCVPPCPTGALDINLLKDQETKGDNKPPKLNINNAQMGLAVVNKESCVAFWGVQCDACYRACPLMNEAIVLEMKRNERTGKHAFIIPEVMASSCTGCGLCEHACITEIPAIKVFPRKMVMGKDGNHYIKGWEADDEKRLNEIKKAEKYSDDNAGAIDYLNNSDDLFTDD